MIMLSTHFTQDEMTKSQTAERMGIVNMPDVNQIVCMKKLLINVLEPIREHYDKPIQPSSGFRSPALCEAIGSKSTSQHCKGEAVDFEVMGVSNLEVAEWIMQNLEFDQLILECWHGGNTGWVHVSYTDHPNRMEVLTYDKFSGFKKGLPNW
jgi:zinc D-Ala-D-Ala carboxypeptidase